MQILDKFPIEGGQKDPKKRIIPFLPGNEWPVSPPRLHQTRPRIDNVCLETDEASPPAERVPADSAPSVSPSPASFSGLNSAFVIVCQTQVIDH